jgi:tetratricopeptide (TPR) repeat protein
LKQKRHGRAIDDFDMAIRLNPANVDALYMRALAFFSRGATEHSVIDMYRAVKGYQEVLRIQPDHAAAAAELNHIRDAGEK